MSDEMAQNTAAGRQTSQADRLSGAAKAKACKALTAKGCPAPCRRSSARTAAWPTRRASRRSPVARAAGRPSRSPSQSMKLWVVAGFVTPGMRVDVLASGNPPGEGATERVVTETILQNIQVLSAGTDIQRDAEGKPQQVQVVNLLVTPEQAELLSLAAISLKIQLVLRNPLDTQMTKIAPTAMSNLFGNQARQRHMSEPRGALPGMRRNPIRCPPCPRSWGLDQSGCRLWRF